MYNIPAHLRKDGFVTYKGNTVALKGTGRISSVPLDDFARAGGIHPRTVLAIENGEHIPNDTESRHLALARQMTQSTEQGDQAQHS